MTVVLAPCRDTLALIDAATLEMLPFAAYACHADGTIACFNRKAAELWGREPRCGDGCDVFCGSFRVLLPDGQAVPHDCTPVADALRTGQPQRDREAVIEQPSGRHVRVRANIDLLRDDDGNIVGAINCFSEVLESDDGVRSSDALLRAIVETTPEAVAIIADDGTVLYLNPAGMRLFGADETALRERSIYDAIAAEDRERWRAMHDRTRAGERLDWAFDLFDGDRRRHHMEVHAVPIATAHGAVAQLAILRDVSDRKRTEAYAKRLADIVECSQDAILSEDLDGIIQTWNEGAERLFGYRREDIVGRHIEVIVSAERRHEIAQLLTRVRDGQGVESYETVRVRKDGSAVDVSVSVSVLKDARGVVAGVAKIYRDISDRKFTEQLIRESRQRLTREADGLRTLNELSSRLWHCHGLHEGMREILAAIRGLVHAEKGNVQLIEDGRLRIVAQHGLGPEFLAVFRDVSLDHESACGRAWRSGRRVIIPDVEEDGAFAYVDIARAEGFRAVFSVPLLTRDGAILGVVSTHFVDVRHLSEAELHRVDLYVRQAVDFIQRCRTDEVLRESEKQLRAANQRKNEFLATLAHELRNPLAPIRNALSVLRMPGAPGDPRRLYAILDRQVSNMVRLVDDLLDVSRISRGKFELKTQHMDLREALAVAIETSRPLIDQRGHRVTADLSGEPLYVDGDLVRLSQVFSNLLNNAAKYTENGGRIDVALARTGDRARVSVRDTGIGIAGEAMGGIFEIFGQVDRRPERAEGGLGVGLWLVKRLVELHGGKVIVESAGPGHGCCFSVELPIDAEPSPQAGAP